MAVIEDKQKEKPSTARTLGSAARVVAQTATPVGMSSLASKATGKAIGNRLEPVRRVLSDFAGGFVGSSQGSSAQPQPAAPRPAAATRAPAGGEAPAAVSRLPNAAAAGVASVPKPGDPQTFTGAGGTRQLPSFAPAEQQNPVQRRLSQPVVAPDNPTRHVGPRTQGAVIGNPGGASGGVYGGEAARRLEIALSTVGRGSPSVRRGLMEAYMQQQGGQQEADLAKQNAGAAADLQQQQNVADANEGFAERRLGAAQFNTDVALQQAQTAAEGQRATRTLTDQSGNTNVLRADGSLTPLTGADGQSVREQTGAGQVTPEVQYSALADQMKAITENPMLQPDERQAMLAPIQAQMDTLAGKVQQAKPSLDQFLAAAKQSNSQMTAEQLTAYYNERYGN